MPTPNSLLIILNPNAAKGKARNHKKTIEEYFFSRDIPFKMVLTEKPLDAIQLAKEGTLEGYKTIIAAGGDGTLNEVVDGMTRAMREKGISVEEAPVVGQIPIGRGNDFAFVAEIPREVEPACALIAKGEWLYTDYGELFGGKFPEGRCFINGVGIGVEPQVNFLASDFKRISGIPSYIFAFIKMLGDFPSPMHLKVKGDDTSFEVNSQQLSICNGKRMGSAFIMGPNAIIDDGKFDIVYANQPIKKREILKYVFKFFPGTQLETDRFSEFRTTEISVEAEGEIMKVHCDGEEVSRTCRSLRVVIFPKGIKIIRKTVWLFD